MCKKQVNDPHQPVGAVDIPCSSGSVANSAACDGYLNFGEVGVGGRNACDQGRAGGTGSNPVEIACGDYKT